MGNCLAPSKQRRQVHELEEEEEHNLPAVINDEFDHKTMAETGETISNNGEEIDGGSGGGGGMKVKIVLTKEELEWLMYELKVRNNSGRGGSTKKLEDALAEIERNRALKSVNNNNCWHPSLESITESPEELGSGRYRY